MGSTVSSENRSTRVGLLDELLVEEVSFSVISESVVGGGGILETENTIYRPLNGPSHDHNKLHLTSDSIAEFHPLQRPLAWGNSSIKGMFHQHSDSAGISEIQVNTAMSRTSGSESGRAC